MPVAAIACAWVESPLQLLCAIEYAAETHTSVRVVPRAGAVQLEETAQRVTALGLPHGVSIAQPRAVPFDGFLGPSSRHWIIGDVFSGVARSAIALRMPERLTIVDDGSATLSLPAALAGSAHIGRTGENRGVAAIGELASRRIRALDARGDLELFSYYELDHAAAFRNRFRWLRSRGLNSAVDGNVILGSAAVVDGSLAAEDYFDWLRSQATPALYFPHRRETPSALRRIAELPGITVQSTGLPIELVLAGARDLAISSLPSSAVDTLGVILAGTGSTIDCARAESSVAA